jgi:hypothetical protein
MLAAAMEVDESVEEQIHRAELLFDRGDRMHAANLLRQLRERYAARRDTSALERVAKAVEQMRSELTNQERAHFDTVLAATVPSAGSAATLSQAEPNSGQSVSGEDVARRLWGAGLVLVGAVAMVVSAFLPYAESSTFARIEQNTMIQHGNGWLFLLIALSSAGAAWRGYIIGKETRAPAIGGAAGLALAIYTGTNLGELCPVGPSADLGVGCSTPSPGIGVYMAGVAACLILSGSWRFMRPAPRVRVNRGSPGALKTCPDCAEEVRAAARICKHCGYRFEVGPTG